MTLALCSRAAAQEAPAPTAAPERVAPALASTPVPITYPDDADGRSARITFVLTISATGSVVEAAVGSVEPADSSASLVTAASDYVRTLVFSPARRDGVAIAARVRFAVVVEPELLDTELEEPAAAATPAVAEDSAPAETTEREEDDEDDSAAEEDVPSYAATGTVERLGTRPPTAASDMTIHIGALRSVPRTRPADFLRLAPGVLLTNEGGDGHADRIYLRGFDARQGQDLELTVQGIPVNEPGNPHGEGYGDLNFIVPELIQSVRVVEGPFDPSQGNYAVAGSAQYELGLERRQLAIQYQGGSFNTHRISLLYGPEGFGPGTFFGGDLRTTDGYGTNRAARHARAMGQIETSLSSDVLLRVLGFAYATRYSSAGLVRQDDVDAGRVGFFGTYDPTQGGDSSRYGLAISLDDVGDDHAFRNMAWVTLRDFVLRENYTGFLEDPPAQYRSGTAQRGDEVSQAASTVELGLRGSYQRRLDIAGNPLRIEAGYYGRYDIVDSSQRRLRFGTNTPYRVDFDYQHQIANIGLYASLDLRLFGFLTVRGGVRGDYFHYDTLDRCALHDTTLISSVPVLDVLCYERDRTGPRDPSSRRTSSGLALQPRGTVILGPLEGLSLVGSIGQGARASDPTYLGDGDLAPMIQILAMEGGIVFSRTIEDVAIDARAAGFYTHVGRDLIFNQQEGRYTLAPGTQRYGALLAARVTAPWIDAAVSGTWAQARFEREVMDPGSTYFPPDTGDRVPYVPTWVLRADVAVHGALDFLVIDGTALYGNIGVGASYVSGRALLYGQTGQDISVVDVGGAIGWRAVEIGLTAQNLFDARYHSYELNYASDFRQGASSPDLIPARAFVAGAPLTIMATLALRYDSSEWQRPEAHR